MESCLRNATAAAATAAEDGAVLKMCQFFNEMTESRKGDERHERGQPKKSERQNASAESNASSAPADGIRGVGIYVCNRLVDFQAARQAFAGRSAEANAVGAAEQQERAPASGRRSIPGGSDSRTPRSTANPFSQPAQHAPPAPTGERSGPCREVCDRLVDFQAARQAFAGRSGSASADDAAPQQERPPATDQRSVRGDSGPRTPRITAEPSTSAVEAPVARMKSICDCLPPLVVETENPSSRPLGIRVTDGRDRPTEIERPPASPTSPPAPRNAPPAPAGDCGEVTTDDAPVLLPQESLPGDTRWYDDTLAQGGRRTRAARFAACRRLLELRVRAPRAQRVQQPKTRRAGLTITEERQIAERCLPVGVPEDASWYDSTPEEAARVRFAACRALLRRRIYEDDAAAAAVTMRTSSGVCKGAIPRRMPSKHIVGRRIRPPISRDDGDGDPGVPWYDCTLHDGSRAGRWNRFLLCREALGKRLEDALKKR